MWPSFCKKPARALQATMASRISGEIEDAAVKSATLKNVVELAT
jgi:hypothetical protein